MWKNARSIVMLRAIDTQSSVAGYNIDCLFNLCGSVFLHRQVAHEIKLGFAAHYCTDSTKRV